MKIREIIVGFFGLLVIGIWATNVYNFMPNPMQGTQKIVIPFTVKNKEGKLLFSDFCSVNVVDNPIMITKSLQSHLTKKFKAMSNAERLKFGGFQDYGLHSQRWIVFQGTRMFKLFSKEQSLIDNYDRLDKKYHTLPLTVVYLEK